MNVLVVGKFHAESTPPDLEDALIAMGHTPIRFTFPQPSISQHSFLNKVYKVKNTLNVFYQKTQYYEKKILKRLERTLSNQQFDFILVNRDFFTPRQVKYVKQLTNAPIAFWFTDHIGQLNKMMFLNAPYDFSFF